MVELATRVALGATLAELGWPDGLLPPPPLVAVKAPVFSTAKLRGVDPSLGPGMQSTGEVIGHPHGRAGRAGQGAARRRRSCRPVPGAEGACRWPCVSIADRDKAGLPRAGAPPSPRPATALAATAGTAAALAAAGPRRAEVVASSGEAARPGADPGILDAHRSRATCRLVVNTPSPRSGAVRDAAAIRHAAVAEGILCLTAIETAIAAAEALDPAIAGRLAEVRSLNEWVPDAGRAMRRPPGDGATPVGARAQDEATKSAWPSDQRVRVVRPTMSTASGTCREPDRRGSAAAARRRRIRPPRTTWPAQAPTMWPPTTAPSWSVQTQPGGSHAAVGSKNAVPKKVPALLERVGDRDDDPLPVDDAGT